MDRFDLLEDPGDAMFDEIQEEDTKLPSGWTTIKMAIPRDFLPIFEGTLKAYKALRETDKDFPAFEAIVLEAKNSLESF